MLPLICSMPDAVGACVSQPTHNTAVSSTEGLRGLAWLSELSGGYQLLAGAQSGQHLMLPLLPLACFAELCDGFV